jgi:hypothetical protein
MMHPVLKYEAPFKMWAIHVQAVLAVGPCVVLVQLKMEFRLASALALSFTCVEHACDW